MSEESKFPRELSQIRSIVQKKLEEINPKSRENWTHVSGGCETGATWRRNMQAFEGLGFNVKTINSVNKQAVDLSVDILGTRWDLPVAIAPMSAAIANVCDHPFIEMARGAKAAGTAASVGYPNGPDVHSKMVQTGTPVFRIIKPLKDIHKIIEAVQDSEASGCFATGIDTDSAAGLKAAGDTCHFDEMMRPLSLDELKEIRKSVKIPFMIKGVMGVEDARSAMEIGAAAIVVSNHAGFALDYCQSPLEVLPGIVKVVDHKMKIFVDSGIRRGSDIAKALALGADAVLIGRLAVWGLVMGGGEGLSWILGLLADEMKRIMVLTGASKLSDLSMKSLVSLDAIGDKILSAS